MPLLVALAPLSVFSHTITFYRLTVSQNTSNLDKLEFSIDFQTIYIPNDLSRENITRLSTIIRELTANKPYIILLPDDVYSDFNSIKFSPRHIQNLPADYNGGAMDLILLLSASITLYPESICPLPGSLFKSTYTSRRARLPVILNAGFYLENESVIKNTALEGLINVVDVVSLAHTLEIAEITFDESIPILTPTIFQRSDNPDLWTSSVKFGDVMFNNPLTFIKTNLTRVPTGASVPTAVKDAFSSRTIFFLTKFSQSNPSPSYPIGVKTDKAVAPHVINLPTYPISIYKAVATMAQAISEIEEELQKK